MSERINTSIFAGRGRWGFASAVIAISQAAWLTSTVGGSHLLNAAQMKPIFGLGSIGWVLGLILGIIGSQADRVVARVIAIAGVTGNCVGLIATWVTYAKWWVA